VFVLTSTVSADGSISGMYRASLQLAQQSGASGSGVNGTTISDGVKKFFVGGAEQPSNAQPAQPPVTEDQTDKSKTNNQKPASPAAKAENSPKTTDQKKR
jgi:hypothetical protein